MSTQTQLFNTLAQAQSQSTTAQSRAVEARKELLLVQNRVHAAYRQLSKLRDEASRTDMSEAQMLDLSLDVAELDYETCHNAERYAKIDLMRAEGQVKIARFEEAEAGLEYDNFLLSSGQLRVVKGPNLDSPLGQWRKQLDVALDVPSTMTVLPSPPPDVDTEGKVKHLGTCKSRRRARMPHEAQCDCAFKSAFLRPCLAREKGQVNYRIERLRWQPSLFAPAMQAKAQVIFDLVEGLYQSAQRLFS